MAATIQIAYRTPPYSLALWPLLGLLTCSSRGVVTGLLGRNAEMFDVSMSWGVSCAAADRINLLFCRKYLARTNRPISFFVPSLHRNPTEQRSHPHIRKFSSVLVCTLIYLAVRASLLRLTSAGYPKAKYVTRFRLVALGVAPRVGSTYLQTGRVVPS